MKSISESGANREKRGRNGSGIRRQIRGLTADFPCRAAQTNLPIGRNCYFSVSNNALLFFCMVTGASLSLSSILAAALRRRLGHFMNANEPGSRLFSLLHTSRERFLLFTKFPR